jgi:tetratricopeptide (TPR) repeat protein
VDTAGIHEEEREKTVESSIRRALDALKNRDAEAGVAYLEEALGIDCEHEETLYALRSIHWWLEKLADSEQRTTPYDKGYFIMGQCAAFYDFLEEQGKHFERSRYAVRQFVYGTALEAFEPVLAEGLRHDPGLLFLIGRCYKGIGSYDTALEYLTKAAHFRQEDGAALAELADVHALLGEIKTAKVLFREAFFINPQGIDLFALESEMITALLKTVRGAGISGASLVEWIPVYGALLGVFSVKRELKLAELGKLKQAVFALENEVRTNSEENQTSVPRLLNRYLWLLDHYENAGENDAQIKEIQLKIQFIDPTIYERYMGVK